MERRQLTWTVCALLAAPSLGLAHGGRYPGKGGYSLFPPRQGITWNTWWECSRHQFVARTSASRISRATLDEVVLPGIDRAIRETEDNKIIASYLHSIARAGRHLESEGVLALLQRHVGHPSEYVSRAAILAMGIVGDPRAGRMLSNLATNSLSAREHLDPDQLRPVSQKRRAAACQSLGLLAHDSSLPFGIRSDICDALATTLQQSAQPEVTVAAIQGLSLLHAPAAHPDPNERGLLRVALRALTHHWDNRQLPNLLVNTQSRVPLAIARLLGQGNTGYHRCSKERMLAVLRARMTRPCERMAVLLALGQLAEPTVEDRKYASALMQAARERTVASRCHATLALGYIGGEQTRAFLLELLQQPNRSGIPQCAALALGVSWLAASGTNKNNHVGELILLRKQSSRRPDMVNACAVALKLINPGKTGGIPAPRDVRAAVVQLIDSLVDVRLSSAVRLSRARTLASHGDHRGLPWVAHVIGVDGFDPDQASWRRWGAPEFGGGRRPLNYVPVPPQGGPGGPRPPVREAPRARSTSAGATATRAVATFAGRSVFPSPSIGSPPARPATREPFDRHRGPQPPGPTWRGCRQTASDR